MAWYNRVATIFLLKLELQLFDNDEIGRNFDGIHLLLIKTS